MSRLEPSVLELMQIHVEALYRHDTHARIQSVNDFKYSLAPRFFLGRTREGSLWRFRADLPDDVCERLESLCRDEPIDNLRPPKYQDDYKRILSAHAPIKKVWYGPAYCFTDQVDVEAGPVAITEEDAHLLRGELQAWQPGIPYEQPCMAIIERGRALSLCASVRISDSAHEAGIETIPSCRRKGYATKVALAWAQAVSELGALPLYSTSFENPASLNLAGRLGLFQFGVDFHLS